MKHQMLTLRLGPLHILAQGGNVQPECGQGEAEMIWANYCRHVKPFTWEHHVLPAPSLASCLLFSVCAHACVGVRIFKRCYLFPCFFANSLLRYLWLKKVWWGSREEVPLCFVLAAALWVKRGVPKSRVRSHRAWGPVLRKRSAVVTSPRVLVLMVLRSPACQVKDREWPKANDHEAAFGQFNSPNLRSDEYLCPSKGGDRNVAALTWIDLSQDKTAAPSLGGRSGSRLTAKL